MKALIDHLFKQGIALESSSEKQTRFWVDPTSQKAFDMLPQTLNLNAVYFEHEGVVERFFQDIPESYFQLIEATDFKLDAIFELKHNFCKSMKNFDSIRCHLAQGNALKQILQRFRKPLALLTIDTQALNTSQYQVLSQPEIQQFELDSKAEEVANTIHFKADGSFKLLK